MRGSVAVHAFKTISRPYYEEVRDEIKKLAPRAKMPPYEAMPQSAIIGLVDVVSCEVEANSKWHDAGQCGFKLAKPRVLLKPIPCDDWLDFWEVPEHLVRFAPVEVESVCEVSILYSDCD